MTTTPRRTQAVDPTDRLAILLEIYGLLLALRFAKADASQTLEAMRATKRLEALIAANDSQLLRDADAVIDQFPEVLALVQACADRVEAEMDRSNARCVDTFSLRHDLEEWLAQEDDNDEAPTDAVRRCLDANEKRQKEWRTRRMVRVLEWKAKRLAEQTKASP